jgi:hypothetical protein
LDGYHVVLAANGKELVAASPTGCRGLIVDLNMPVGRLPHQLARPQPPEVKPRLTFDGSEDAVIAPSARARAFLTRPTSSSSP